MMDFLNGILGGFPLGDPSVVPGGSLGVGNCIPLLGTLDVRWFPSWSLNFQIVIGFQRLASGVLLI